MVIFFRLQIGRDWLPPSPQSMLQHPKHIILSPDAEVVDVERFRRAVPEIIGACNCFALEEWAASVFHSMRVMEVLLVCLAKKFSLPYEMKEWHTIIEGIESAVRAIDKNYSPNWKDDVQDRNETINSVTSQQEALYAAFVGGNSLCCRSRGCADPNASFNRGARSSATHRPRGLFSGPGN